MLNDCGLVYFRRENFSQIKRSGNFAQDLKKQIKVKLNVFCLEIFMFLSLFGRTLSSRNLFVEKYVMFWRKYRRFQPWNSNENLQPSQRNCRFKVS